MAFARYIVVVAVDGFQLGDERTHFAGIADRVDDLLHHQFAVEACKVLRPFHGFDVVIEVLGALGEICQVLIRQIDEKLLHILARHFNEVAAHAVADAARATVQHEPDGFRFVETNFDEVVAGAERAKVIGVVAAIEFGVLFENGVVTRL